MIHNKDRMLGKKKEKRKKKGAHYCPRDNILPKKHNFQKSLTNSRKVEENWEIL